MHRNGQHRCMHVHMRMLHVQQRVTRMPRACQAQAMHKPLHSRAQATARTLHCAITRSGLETMNIGAAMMGARREAKSLVAVTEEMLRTPTPERTERLPSRRAALHI